MTDLIRASVEYSRVEEIGKGAGRNSRVWRALDPQLGTEIVVKEIPKEDFGNLTNTYFNEANILYETRCKNIVPIHYACDTRYEVVIAMPFMRKGALSSRIAKGSLGIKEALRVAQSVLNAVAHVHSKGLIHFDIKPSNVLFSDLDEPLLADFGHARRVVYEDGTVLVPNTMYDESMPPDAFTGRGSIHVDIYQCGLLLYRMLNGQPFYLPQVPTPDDMRLAICEGRFPDRESFLPHIPAALRRIVQRALQIDPSQRHSSAMELADELGRVSVEVDWSATFDDAGAIHWSARSTTGTNLIVELQRTGQRYSVATYTERGGKRRAAKRTDLWQTGLTKQQALVHLKRVFRQFGRRT